MVCIPEIVKKKINKKKKKAPFFIYMAMDEMVLEMLVSGACFHIHKCSIFTRQCCGVNEWGPSPSLEDNLQPCINEVLTKCHQSADEAQKDSILLILTLCVHVYVSVTRPSLGVNVLNDPEITLYACMLQKKKNQ